MTKLFSYSKVQLAPTNHVLIARWLWEICIWGMLILRELQNLMKKQ